MIESEKIFKARMLQAFYDTEVYRGVRIPIPCGHIIQSMNIEEKPIDNTYQYKAASCVGVNFIQSATQFNPCKAVVPKYVIQMLAEEMYGDIRRQLVKANAMLPRVNLPELETVSGILNAVIESITV